MKIICVVIAAFMVTTTAWASETGKPKEYPGLKNFHEVNTGIWRGAAPTDEGLKTLRSMKIHTIIDLRYMTKDVKKEKDTAKEMGFEWINIPMGHEAPKQKQVDLFLSTLAKAPKESVFVHCQHGADRTGCMIGIYRVQVQNWTFKDAWSEMRKYGFKWFLFALKDAVRSRAKKISLIPDQPILDNCSCLTSNLSFFPSQYA